MPMEWKPEYSVGFDRIDQQHQELFHRFNSLMEACKSRQGRDKLRELLQFLDDYVVSHFDEEEKLMAAHSYPAIAEHKEQHRIFCRKLGDLKKILEEEGTSIHLLVATNEAVLQWLIQHIRLIDTALGAFLQNKR